MEKRIVHVLDWKTMNPASTVSAFVRIIEQISKYRSSMMIIPRSLDQQARLQTDAAALDDAFCAILPSTIAGSAWLNMPSGLSPIATFIIEKALEQGSPENLWRCSDSRQTFRRMVPQTKYISFSSLLRKEQFHTPLWRCNERRHHRRPPSIL
jgi:hypothetical protein